MGGGLFSQVGENFGYLSLVGFRCAYVPPTFLCLKEAIVGRVMIRPHEMGDVPFLEYGTMGPRICHFWCSDGIFLRKEQNGGKGAEGK